MREPASHEHAPLDRAVAAAAAELARLKIQSPDVLCWMSSGVGLLPARLEAAGKLPLSRLSGAPAAWGECLLHYGRSAGLGVWLLEPPLLSTEQAPWVAAFPIWLAAASGARVLLHVGLGTALGGLERGTLALATDHLHLGGTSPLVGLGESRLGPLFPDQTRTHDPRLRRAALEACRKSGLAASETVVALTAGPALETFAEQRWYSSAGAGVSNPDAGPALLASSHAGLEVLCVTAVCAIAGEPRDVATLASIAERLAPALEDFVGAWLGEVGQSWPEREAEAAALP